MALIRGVTWALSLLPLVINVAAQSSNVTQCIPAYSWAMNSKQQTPCLVAAYLEGVCTSQPFNVDPLPPGTHYLGPNSSNANPCICSTVAYSLVSACGGCQNRTFTSWGNWSLYCTSTEIATFPEAIPSGTDVPVWAYLDVTTFVNETFDPVAAQESLFGSPVTSSITSASSSIQQSSTVSSAISQPTVSALIPSSTAVNHASSHSNAGAIAGGVVGGLVLFAVVALVALWWFIRRRNPRAHDNRDFVTPLTNMVSSTGLPDGPSLLSTNPYIGSDTTTSPGSPVTSAVYTTLPSRRSLESMSHYGPSVAPSRGYTGAPEVL